jgi:hypothetical protein
MIIAALHD